MMIKLGGFMVVAIGAVATLVKMLSVFRQESLLMSVSMLFYKFRPAGSKNQN